MIRFGITSLCFLPLINTNQLKKLDLKNIIILIIASFFGVFLYSYLFFVAINYTSPINISLVNATTPILTLLVSSILFFTIPSAQQLGAFLLSFLGVALVITKGTCNVSILKASYGEFLMFIGALTWVIYGFLIKNLMHTLSPLFVTFLTSFFGFILLLLYAIYAHHLPILYSLTSIHWLALLYMSVLGTALTFWLYADIMKSIGPKKTNLFIFSAAPIASMILSYLLFGTSINFWQILGASFVVIALMLSSS